jgi:predicted acetyltransferase
VVQIAVDVYLRHKRGLTLEIRTLTPEDLPAFRDIHTHSFGNGEPSTYSEEDMNRESAIGVFESGRLRAVLGILDFEMFFGSDRRPCGGVTSVACDPAERGKGYAGAMVKRGLELQREKGQYLSSLWPFDQRFYRHYGYEWTGAVREYKVPVKLMKPDPESQYVESITENIMETMNPLYESIARRYNGAIARDEWIWNIITTRFKKRQPANYVYRRDGQVEGYATIRFPNSLGNNEEKEYGYACSFAADTPRAYKGLLGLIHHHSMTTEKFKWRTPADDSLWSILCHWGVETHLSHTVMGRIVDLQSAITALKPDPAIRGSGVFLLKDEHAPWNAGNWQLTVEEGHAEVTRTDREPGVSLDIQALTQAYWGMPSLLELRRAERLTVHNEADFTFLSDVFPAKTVWTIDDF